MSQLSAEQLSALTSLADALKGTTIEDLVKSQLNIKTDEEQKKAKTALDDLENTTTSLDGIQALIGLHIDHHINKVVPKNISFVIPNFSKMFYVLASMDFHISNNFYARRGIPTMDPTLSRLYMSIIAIIQVLRCQNHARAITPSDAAFLTDLLEQFPPHTLPVPGPLIPFLKSTCISFPENPEFIKVCPALPKGYPQLPTSLTNPTLTGKRIQDRYLDTSHIDWHIPFPPYLAFMHHSLFHTTHTDITFGNNDSAASGMKTITPKTTEGFETPLDYLLAKSKTDRQQKFPFFLIKNPSVNAVTNATTDASQHLQVNLFNNLANGTLPHRNAAHRQGLTKVGISEPIRINPDLVKQMHTSHSLIDVPNPIDEYLNGDTYDNISEVLLMSEGFEWFSKLVSHMSMYSRFFPQSGTLADCSLEGPRVLQHVSNIISPSTPIDAPTYHGDEKKLLRFRHKTTTTVRDSNAIVEATSAYTCLNIDAPNYYSYIPTLGKGTRSRNFWEIRPIFDNSTIDTAYIKTDTAISKQVISKPKDTV